MEETKWHEGKGEEVSSFDNSVNGDPNEKKKREKKRGKEKGRGKQTKEIL